MAEKLTRREKIALQKQSGAFNPKKINEAGRKRNSLQRTLSILIAVAAFFLYANTLSHDYVLDDYGLIKDNTITRQGVSAIPEIFSTSYRSGMNITDYQLYRPLSKAMFAIEWNISPNNPSLHHWINVLFYSLSCFVLFHLLCLYFKNDLLIPFITTLLFTAHPLHTEVVANIKSRDEIVGMLLCLCAAGSFFRYAMFNSRKYFFAGTVSFFLALLTKESAITFLAVVPLTFYFFADVPRTKYVNTLSAMAGVTVLFLLIRHKVLGSVEVLIPVEDNSLVAIKDIFLQRANAIYLLGVYMKKFLLPFPLVSDGSYNTFPPVTFTDWRFLLSFALLVFAAVFAIMKFKRKDPVSFAILFFFATVSIVCNVIILIGTNYGERLMYVPSLGFCLVLAIIITRVLKTASSEIVAGDLKTFFNKYSKQTLITIVIVAFFSFQTIARNTEWKDNYTLYSNDVLKVPNSAHMLFYFANHITAEEYLDEITDSTAKNKLMYEGIEYLNRAIKIFPRYSDGYQRRGFIYNSLGDTVQAEKDYTEALKYNHTHSIVYNNLGTLYFRERKYEEARKNFELAVKYNPNYAHALSNLASVYGVYGESEREMMKLEPAAADRHSIQARENYQTAINWFQKAIKADPEFADPYRMIYITYRTMGDEAQASRYERLYNNMPKKKNAAN